MYRNRIKRLLDILLSACGILCLSWLLLLLAVAIKLDSPGPVFFRQKRVGIGKRHFQILKFRTMRVYHYSDIRVMAATFPTVAYGSLAWSLASLSLLFMGHGVPVRRLTAYQTYLITLFNFQRTLVKRSWNEVVSHSVYIRLFHSDFKT